MQAGTQRAKAIFPSLCGREARKNAELGTRNIKPPSHSLTSHGTSAKALSWVSYNMGMFVDPSSFTDFWESHELIYTIFL